MATSPQYAHGSPGIPPRWTSSAKTAIGTAIDNKSHVWFTLSHGIFNEIYYPDVDQACTRDMGLIVTDGKSFFSEEKRDATSKLLSSDENTIEFKLINTCKQKRYTIEKQIIADPRRDSVLQKTKFTPLQDTLSTYGLYVLLSPHLADKGYGNNAWVEEFEGHTLLFAQRDGSSLALACSVPFLRQSVGYVGTSDGWQDLHEHQKMTWNYTRAENGNVAMTAEINLASSKGEFVLALGFGKNPDGAAKNALASLKSNFDELQKEFSAGWQEWFQTKKISPPSVSFQPALSRVSKAVLRTHESKTTPGGLIASLAIPWGFSKGDDDMGGYHLVWARDMMETAGALLSFGSIPDTLKAIQFLQMTQKADGHWPQNMWINGSSYWNGIQMDETALPIVLVDHAFREKALDKDQVKLYWPMMRKAAAFIVQNGPVSQQDRWEEDPGYTPFTIAAEITSLLVAADHAQFNGEPEVATYLRETADIWNDSIEKWLYITGTDWCKEFQVEGYYARIVPENSEFDGKENVIVKNVELGKSLMTTGHLISPDALAFVRFGLRAADDPRMVNTVKVVDALLKIETPHGPTWHRYNDDGYGEHQDGSPFDGTGIGRGWPLLTGERAHYELAAGRWEEAYRLLKAIESFTNEGGLIPEQVWDSPDIPERELFFGKPAGSAMPLAWAHAEYLKLCRSLEDKKVFDMPPQTVQRYLVDKIHSPRRAWRFNHQIRSMGVGKKLRVETSATAIVHWSADNWKTTQESRTHDTGLGLHIVDLSTEKLPQGSRIAFTFYWPHSGNWENVNFGVNVTAD